MYNKLIETFKRQAFEQRAEDLDPAEHRLLSFWQAYFSCAQVRDGGAKKYPNKERENPIPYEWDAAYWLYALQKPQQVEAFVNLGEEIATKMEQPQFYAMLSFISNLNTSDLRDNEALHLLHTKAHELTAQ